MPYRNRRGYTAGGWFADLIRDPEGRFLLTGVAIIALSAIAAIIIGAA